MKSSTTFFQKAALAAALALCVGVPGAKALECPTPQTPGGGPAAANAELTRQLSTKGVESQLPGILGALRQQYPKASRGELTDYLIESYCPIVKGDASLNEQEKQARVKEFANSVVATQY